ncbi:MAG: hypothetical protein PVF73_11930 [Bacteroidales bacterium]|jgi:hypothetical protein
MFDYKSKLADSSRLLADILVKEIGDSPEKFDEMMNVTLLDIYPYSMRAARILALCSENNAKLMNKHIGKMALALKSLKVEGVRRGFLKILSDHPENIDEHSWGIITDLAFDWLGNPKEAISIRYYCMELLLYLQHQYPELKEEFVSILESIVRESSQGLKTKCRHTLKRLNK